MTDEPIRVLTVTAHPDDTEFGFGGTIARWADEGRLIWYCVATNGNKGTADRSLSPDRLAVIREKEQRAAAKVLGVQDVFFLGYSDGELEDTREFLGQVVRVMRQVRPDVVVTMNPYPVTRFVQHRDHRVAGQVTIDAVYPFARDHLHFPEHISDGLEPHKVGELYISGTENPDTYVDITDYIDRKIEALRCHRSQMENADSPDFAERFKMNAARSAEPFGVPMAETFRRIEIRR
jgi:LmbE family N-acetylglucosaminyl deacetylase